MENARKMLQSINKLEPEYNKRKNKDKFNVFTALHKERDEVNLHSRFISYLLSPKSGHGMKDVLLEIFVREILKINEEEFDLSSCEVIPNELNKTEEDEIDIFIKNKNRQAIIIENKIDAKDSYHENKKEGYKGQLERLEFLTNSAQKVKRYFY